METRLTRVEETKLYAFLRKLYPYLGVVLVCSGILFIHYRRIWIDENYPPLGSIATEFSGKIIKSTTARVYNGTYLIELDNGVRFLLGSHTTNYDYQPSDLYALLSIGDSIYHPRNRDTGGTLYVYRNGKEYYFVLGKVINKKQEPYYRKYFHKKE